MKKNTFKCAGNIGSGKGVTLAKSAAKLVRSCKPRNILITVRCSAHDKDFLKEVAQSQGISLQKFMLEAAKVEAEKVFCACSNPGL